MTDYTLHLELPSVAEYRHLRQIAGMTPRSEAAARAGLPASACAVVIRHEGRAVGMARVAGDALAYTLADVAVDPDHQGRGLGKRMMAALMERLQQIAPAEAFVSLIADGDAQHLYAKYGFRDPAPASIGMEQWIGRKDAE
ncbi:GNAT family N-acetyltransferase [Pseudoroseicyclus aestuarii]|uniref:Acetyltransferase (GNAT) family protein n=1 Tax=Pseudoroseicyclus aestuarii TaxID=1795041 RepID=A0A318SRE7_9RHOB|nr:GNAT family N-acetyltransferase [Pseudoroseicyclus aestuarii]PYE84243.1 acetyltransferase (GNAT) family protein [Pseudoroseicyclus aestuarii]